MVETAFATAPGTSSGIVAKLNSSWHKPAMLTFLGITLAHWAEHLAQAVQIWGLGWARPQARGVLGIWFPWLVTSEWLHYAYAVVMLVLLMLLRPAMVGRARIWWNLALGIQVWHHFEHFLLLAQAVSGQNLFGAKVPTSIIQALIPKMRVELHLFYNAVVFVPMVVAMVYHTWPPRDEKARPTCNCLAHSRGAAG